VAVSTNQGRTGIGVIASGTWANRPSSPVQWSYYFATDVGDNGVLFQHNGTRWRVSNGIATLKMLGAPSATVTNVETILAQTVALPAGSWQVNDSIRLYYDLSKSGTTNTTSMNVYVGTAGTTGDAKITNLSNLVLTAAQTTSAGVYGMKLTANTTVRPIGYGTGAGYSGSTTTSMTSNTVSDASANALIISVSLLENGTTDTSQLQDCRIELITP
jgi:hypothetical protein